MVRLLIRKYKEIGWDASRWRYKRKKYKKRIDYDLNKLMILYWILGRLNKAGNKSFSFFILTNIMLLLKKIRKEIPKDILCLLLRKMKQNVLLFNKKKGSLVFELPRFLTIEQSIKKIIEWLIKVAEKNKENIIISIMKELKNIFLKKGEIFKKKKNIADTILKNKPFFFLIKKKKKNNKCKIHFV